MEEQAVLDFWNNAASLLGNRGIASKEWLLPSLARGRQNIWGASLPKITISGKMPQTKQAQKVEAWVLPSADGAPPVRFPCVTVTALTMQCYFAHVMTSYTSTFLTLSSTTGTPSFSLSSFTCCSTESYSYTAAAWQTSFCTSAYHLLGLTKDTGDQAASHILAAF